jgi:hypothetical protein
LTAPDRPPPHPHPLSCCPLTCSLQCVLERKHKLSEKSSFKVRLTAGLQQQELELLVARQMSPRSRMNIGTSIGRKGVRLHVRLQRGVARFNVPVVLSPGPSLLMFSAACLLPSLVAGFVKRAARGRRGVRERQRLAGEEDAAHVAWQAAVEDAKLQLQLLAPRARLRRQKEREVEVGGLLIEKATCVYTTSFAKRHSPLTVLSLPLCSASVHCVCASLQQPSQLACWRIVLLWVGTVTAWPRLIRPPPRPPLAAATTAYYYSAPMRTRNTGTALVAPSRT